MQVTTEVLKTSSFKPCRITIDVETASELKALWSIFNRSATDIVEHAAAREVIIPDSYKQELCNEMYAAWQKFDMLMNEFKLR